MLTRIFRLQQETYAWCLVQIGSQFLAMNSTFWHLDEVICGFCHLSDVSRKSAGSGTVDRDLWCLMRKKK